MVFKIGVCFALGSLYCLMSELQEKLLLCGVFPHSIYIPTVAISRCIEMLHNVTALTFEAIVLQLRIWTYFLRKVWS